jgi:hypothetical protein
MEKRGWYRIKCTRPLCGNDGKLELIGEWQSNDYCKYIMVLCPNCVGRYWMIKREGKYELKWRKDGEAFDHRKDDRKGN